MWLNLEARLLSLDSDSGYNRQGMAESWYMSVFAILS